MRRLIRVTRLLGATVYVHWSVLAVITLLLLGAIENAPVTLFLAIAYLGVLLLHEWGHAVAARRRGYAVWSIELYPYHGLTRYDAPHTHYDECVVAWGGVLAQFAVALPLIAWTILFGFTPFGVINAVIAIFGYLSPVVAVFNLLPTGRLDGATAWQIVPYLWRRRRWPRWEASARREPEIKRTERRRGPWVH